MDLSTWLLFLGIAMVTIISPGPAVLLSVTNSLAHGFATSVFSSLGNIVGILFVSTAAALGLGAVLETSTLLFASLKFFGAIYLIYLGIRQWRTKHNVFDASIERSNSNPGKGKVFVQGLLVALSNPKSILFFTALFPQFVDLSKPVMIQFFVLTMTFMFFSFWVLLVYSLSARSAKGWFSKGKRAAWLNRISGTVFIAFGFGILRLRNKAV